MKNAYWFFIITTMMIFLSCSTSKSVISYDTNLSKYTYVIFGDESTGDRELDDIVLTIQNEIANTRLKVIPAQDNFTQTTLGKNILSPNIHVLTEKWDGGHTYITITFYDYNTKQRVAVIKSSGIGLTISQDQRIAINAIRKELKKALGNKQ